VLSPHTPQATETKLGKIELDPQSLRFPFCEHRLEVVMHTKVLTDEVTDAETLLKDN
jgi:hypothetical protein